MKTNEESLQQRAEQSLPAVNADEMAYHTVFKALRKNPEFQLPDSFADKLVQKIAGKKESKRDYIFFGLGIAATLVAALIVISITGFTLDFGSLKFISNYKFFIGFAALFILTANQLEKKLIKKKISFS